MMQVIYHATLCLLKQQVREGIKRHLCIWGGHMRTLEAAIE